MTKPKPAVATAAGTSIRELRAVVKASGLPDAQARAIDAILAEREPKKRGRPAGSYDFGMWSLMPAMELLIVEHGCTEERAAGLAAAMIEDGWLDNLRKKRPAEPVEALLRMYQKYKDPAQRRMNWAPGHEPGKKFPRD